MNNILGSFQNPLQYASDWADDVNATIQHQLSREAQKTKKNVVDLGKYIGQGCQYAGNKTGQVCLETLDKVEGFLFHHKSTIFFTSCCLTTAYIAPHLFFFSAIATVVVRIEVERHLKQFFDENWKDEKNPYKLNPNYEMISPIDITLGTLAAIDTLSLGATTIVGASAIATPGGIGASAFATHTFALGAIFIPGLWPLAIIPTLGGVAAGNSIAKMGMNIANRFNTTT